MAKRRLFYGHLSWRFRLKMKLHAVRRWLMARRHVGRFGLCPGCRRWRTDIIAHRQLTAYTDEASNWMTHCSDCQKESDEYWTERWRDYYSGVL